MDQLPTNRNEISSPPSTVHLDDLMEAHNRRLDSIKSGIIVLCSLFATFCFEAILNPPGGLWSDWPSSSVLNATEAAKAKKYKASLLQLIPVHGPRLNLTAPNLLAPNKAMSLTLEPSAFFDFLHADASCFLASLLTIMLVMITTSYYSLMMTTAMNLMNIVVLGSALSLFRSVLKLVTCDELVTWAVGIAAAESGIILALFVILYLLTVCICQSIIKLHNNRGSSS